MALRPFPAKSRYRSQEFIGAPITSLEQAYLVAYIDGGARGNPGPAGYGVVVEDELGRPWPNLANSWAIRPTTMLNIPACCRR